VSLPIPILFSILLLFQFIDKLIIYPAEQLHNARCKLINHLSLCKFDEQIAYELPWLLAFVAQSLFSQEKEKR
jgi:hypothetical protein